MPDAPDSIGIVQARLSSSRLPGKILAPLAGRPLLAVLVERLRGARVDEWWLATTRERSDDVTAAWGQALGLRVLRGDTEDVLSRFTAILRDRRPRWVVRITADDPFTDAAVVNTLLDAGEEAEKRGEFPVLVGLGEGAPHFPLGYAPQLARADAVVASEAEIPADQPYHRSHVLSWLRARQQPRAVPAPGDWPARPGWRWTVDTELDLRMARAAFELFGSAWREISYPEMVARLDARPDVPRINRDVPQKSLAEG